MFNMKHHDLYMQDGTDPPDSILKSFMHIAETASGAIAVHCKVRLKRALPSFLFFLTEFVFGFSTK